MWTLFSLAILATIGGAWTAVRRHGLRTGLLLSVPIAALMLLTSMALGMVVTFSTHDI